MQEVPPIEVGLELDSAELIHLDWRTRTAYYGIGWVVADAIGLEGHAELDARRESAGLDDLPAAWILRAADLSPLSQENLKAAFKRTMGVQPGTDFSTLSITLKDGTD